jgi:hypothetical protein
LARAKELLWRGLCEPKQYGALLALDKNFMSRNKSSAAPQSSAGMNSEAYSQQSGSILIAINPLTR